MNADEYNQQQLEQQSYWRCLSDTERTVVLDEIDPEWRHHFRTGGFCVHYLDKEAIAFYAPDFDTIWPILQAHDETRITNG